MKKIVKGILISLGMLALLLGVGFGALVWVTYHQVKTSFAEATCETYLKNLQTLGNPAALKEEGSVPEMFRKGVDMGLMMLFPVLMDRAQHGPMPEGELPPQERLVQSANQLYSVCKAKPEIKIMETLGNVEAQSPAQQQATRERVTQLVASVPALTDVTSTRIAQLTYEAVQAKLKQEQLAGLLVSATVELTPVSPSTTSPTQPESPSPTTPSATQPTPPSPTQP